MCILNANNDADGNTCECDKYFYLDEDVDPPICNNCHNYCEECDGHDLLDCLLCRTEEEGIKDTGVCECKIGEGFFELTNSSGDPECHRNNLIFSLN